MNINGTTHYLEGKSFTEIGELLRNASPDKDGLKLRVELTEDEEMVFSRAFGFAVGYALCDILGDAIRAAGGEPQIGYMYTNLVFETHPAASMAEQS